MQSLINRIRSYKFNHRSDNSKHYSNSSIVIKVPVTKWKRAQNWGDYHIAVLLKQQLEKKGHRVLIQIFPEWDNGEGLKYDVAIIIRGLSKYKIKSHQINIMWNISHPDDVSLEEYETYDYVFIASFFWTKEISKRVSVPVRTMLQCTDPDRFKEPTKKDRLEHHQQLLFVGNSREVYRKILKDLLPTKYDLAVYGKGWKNFLPKHIIKDDYIPNEELYKHYGSADILLNDHWDDMREKGFVSNRIFDGLACGAFILTDRVNKMGQLENYVQVYDTAEELNELIDLKLSSKEGCIKYIQSGKKYVIENHTFEKRAKVFSNSIQELLKARLNRNGCDSL